MSERNLCTLKISQYQQKTREKTSVKLLLTLVKKTLSTASNYEEKTADECVVFILPEK